MSRWETEIHRKDDKIATISDIGGEVWILKVLLIDKGQDDQRAMVEANVRSQGYGGPGRSFANKPVVERNGHSILVYQRGGLDI